MLVWLTTLNAKSSNAMTARVSAFKELMTCTLVVSRLTFFRVVDLWSFTQSWKQQARGIILSYSYHTQNQKICYATSTLISGSGRIVHLISGAIRCRPGRMWLCRCIQFFCCILNANCAVPWSWSYVLQLRVLGVSWKASHVLSKMSVYVQKTARLILPPKVTRSINI